MVSGKCQSGGKGTGQVRAMSFGLSAILSRHNAKKKGRTFTVGGLERAKPRRSLSRDPQASSSKKDSKGLVMT